MKEPNQNKDKLYLYDRHVTIEYSQVKMTSRLSGNSDKHRWTMKVEECKLCSVGWGQGPATTDFSISSLMRPTQHVDPRQDAVLMSAYLFKL
ncbi:Uncharacterized protein OBRU01_20179, partial [Operophtera brumata]